MIGKEILHSSDVKNGISTKALIDLVDNAKKMGKFSLRDEGFRKVFLHPGEEMLPRFDRQTWQEMKNVVEAYEGNEEKLQNGIEIPTQSLHWAPFIGPSYWDIIEGKVINVGRAGKDYFGRDVRAPIPDLKVSTKIASFVGYPDENTPKTEDMNAQEIQAVRDNLYILKVLYNYTPTNDLEEIFRE